MNKKITITEGDLITMIKSIVKEQEIAEQSDKKKIKRILKRKACAKKYVTVSAKLTDEGWRKLGEDEKRPSRFSTKLDRERIRNAKCKKEWWVRPKGQSDKVKEKSEKRYRLAGVALTNDFIQAMTKMALEDTTLPITDSAVFDSVSGGTVEAVTEIFENMSALQTLIKSLISWVQSDPKNCDNRKINVAEVSKVNSNPRLEQVIGYLETLGKEVNHPSLKMITKSYVKSLETVLTELNQDEESKKEINDAGYRNVQDMWKRTAVARGKLLAPHITKIQSWIDKVTCSVAEGKSSKITKDKFYPTN